MIINLKNGNEAILRSNIKNDVDGGLPVYWIHEINNRNIIMVIDSQYVLERSYALQGEKDQFNKKEQAFLDFANTLSIENPLVMIQYQLK